MFERVEFFEENRLHALGADNVFAQENLIDREAKNELETQER